ncbi:hypothetical protein JW960_11840 [candidate division KSB1 bacterium]|nr:hypothetical protein [candidate division KSB1 bacterium]
MKQNGLVFKIGLSLCALFLVYSALNAADRILAPPMKHEIRVYVDPANGDVFWPTTLPIYIRLTTSPEEGAPSFLLKNISKANKEGLEKYLDTGIKLEMNGNQFIRWYNYVTKDTMILKFSADGVPPVCTIQFSNAPKFISPKSTFYGKGLKCTVGSNDDVSGVRKTYFSIDGLEFEPYNDEFLCSKEKEFSVRYYAVDMVGNASAVEESKFEVDLTSPTTKHTVETNFAGTVLSPNSTIRLTSEDQLAGVRQIFYNFDDATENQPYNDKAISVDALSDGEHTLNYQAVDRVDNQETPLSYVFYLDKIPPTVNIELEGDQYRSTNQLFASSRTFVVLQASDNKSGVKRIERGVNAKDFTLYEDKFQLPASTDDYKITYRAADILGNMSETNTLVVHMDVAAPVTAYKFIGSNYQQRGINWINQHTQIQLTAADKEAGVILIRYKLGNDPVADYSAPFSVVNEGKYDFQYWAIDRVNNQEQEQTLKIIVDNTPPEIMPNFSVSSIRSERTKDEQMLEVYPRNTSVFLASTDASASSAGIWYSIDGGTELKYETPIVFAKDGTYSLYIRARDRVDNETTKTLAFVIKD